MGQAKAGATRSKEREYYKKKIHLVKRSVLHPEKTTLDVNDVISGVTAHHKQRGMQTLTQNIVLRSLTQCVGRERIPWNDLPN